MSLAPSPVKRTTPTLGFPASGAQKHFPALVCLCVCLPDGVPEITALQTSSGSPGKLPACLEAGLFVPKGFSHLHTPIPSQENWS